MKKILLSSILAVGFAAVAAELSGRCAVYRIDDRTGAIAEVIRKSDGRAVVKVSAAGTFC